MNSRGDLSKGFTLVEVLIVIVVLGVLAGLAIPSYTEYVNQSKADEAKVNLFTIYTAEKVYKVNSRSTSPPDGTYLPISSIAVYTAADMVPINQALNIDLAAPKYYHVFTIGPGATGDIQTSFEATVSER